MRYGKIFLLQFQTVLQERGRAFVWFLMAAISPLILILFWKGAAGNKTIAPGWNFTSLSSYYFLSTIIFSLLITHQENDVSYIDIKDGMLVTYLLKPFSYYLKKLLEEIPYRIVQAFYGCILYIIFFLFLGKQILAFSTDGLTLALSIIIMLLALFISFTIRMLMGISAFWFTDTRGFFEAVYATEFALGGTIVPLVLLPSFAATVAYIFPFAYIVYFPIVSLQGKLTTMELLHVIGIQSLWLVVLVILYHILWHAGVKKFSGIGQ